GPHLENPVKSRLHILIPVTGTRVSREAAEVGIVIARAIDAPVTALHIAGKSRHMARQLRRAMRSRGQQEAVLRDGVDMAGRYGAASGTAVRTAAAREQAILRQAGARGQTLIVMGVNRRPGEKLFFGDVAAAVLARSQRSVLFVSSAAASRTAQAPGAAKP